MCLPISDRGHELNWQATNRIRANDDRRPRLPDFGADRWIKANELDFAALRWHALVLDDVAALPL